MTASQDYRPVAQTKQATTAQLLKVLTPEIARALPRGLDADRIARLAMTEIRKSRNAGGRHSLDDCTHESFAGSLLTASALGLEPGVQGECYLIPFEDKKRRVVECQLIVGYQGIVKLFWQHSRAEYLDAQCVYANDEFRYAKGLNPVLEHIPFRGDIDERGEPVAYYAIVRAKGAQPLWDVFTPKEIGRLRRGKVGPQGDIPDPQRWMERKTALKQVLKLGPKSTRLDLAIRADESTGSELYRAQAMEVPELTGAADYIDTDAVEEPEAAADE